jgi:extracellular matrix regulatory protein A
MAAQLIHVGFGNYVAPERVRDVEIPTTAPVQRLVREGKERNLTLDLTSGRRTKCVLFMDTGQMLLLGITKKEWETRLKSRRSQLPSTDVN